MNIKKLIEKRLKEIERKEKEKESDLQKLLKKFEKKEEFKSIRVPDIEIPDSSNSNK